MGEAQPQPFVPDHLLCRSPHDEAHRRDYDQSRQAVLELIRQNLFAHLFARFDWDFWRRSFLRVEGELALPLIHCDHSIESTRDGHDNSSYFAMLKLLPT
jgi:hypothetical protein